MSRLIESIRLLDGKFSRLEFHQARIDSSFRQVFKSNPEWKLETVLKDREIPCKGLYKCRVVYDDYSVEPEFSSYQVRTVETLKLITNNTIEYRHKWEDRSQLDALYSQRGSCDDILIVKNDLITDTFYANIVFEKNGKWFTPQSHLLPGTMREYLLNTHQIQLADISVDTFTTYQHFKLINAMIEFDSPLQPVTNIILR